MAPNLAVDPLHYSLNLIGEEGTEVGKEAFKILRFGLFDVRPSSGENNLQILQNEVTDLIATIRIANLELVRHGLPPLRLDDEVAIAEKFRKVEFYAERSMERGTLTAPLAYMSGKPQ